MMQMTRGHKEYQNPFWTEEDNLEMATRILVQREFSNLLNDSVSFQDLAALENVFFCTLYPTDHERNRK